MQYSTCHYSHHNSVSLFDNLDFSRTTYLGIYWYITRIAAQVILEIKTVSELIKITQYMNRYLK